MTSTNNRKVRRPRKAVEKLLLERQTPDKVGTGDNLEPIEANVEKPSKPRRQDDEAAQALVPSEPIGEVDRRPPSVPHLGDELPGVVEYKPLRLEHAKISDADPAGYRHAFLTDVSGKSAVFEDIDFSYAVFVRGYFHKAEFRGCKFVGARFTDCNFRNSIFSNCDFSYADFSGTRIPADEILQNLPDAPNISRELLQVLRKNAVSLGDIASARRFVLAEIDATREHLRRAWRQDTNYYRKKYGGFRKRAKIAAQRIGFWIDSFLWGHGERLWKMAISACALLVVSSAISTIYWAFGQADPTISSVSTTFSNSFSYYTSLFLDVQSEQHIDRILWLDWVVVVARYIAFGVLVTGLFRWLSHR
jgi:hypothetical protein